MIVLFATIAIVLCVIVLLFMWWRRNPHPNFPPGPRGFPVVGVLPYLDKYVERMLKKWSLEKYGPVMSVKIGTKTKVVLNNYESIMEAFVKQSPKCGGRPLIPVFQEAQGQYGLLLLNYHNDFHVQRQFCSKTFQKLGVGEEEVEEIINEEVKHLVGRISKKVDEAQDLRWDLYAASTNVLAKINFGKRYEYDDPVFQGFLSTLQSKLKDPSEAKTFFLLTSIPPLSWVPPFSSAKKRFIDRFEKLHDFIRAVVSEHEDSFNKKDLRDFIDHFLYEQEFGKDPSENRFIERQLVAYVRDLFGGGAETTGQELYWVILCLLLYPDRHMEVVEEIDRVIGKDRAPTYNDRILMPLTSAFLQEVWRVSTPITKSIEHLTMEDVKIMGYDIPKGTIVFSNQWGSNHDPKTFPEPMKFKPSRHIDKEGNFIVDNQVVVFSRGIHECIGSDISLMEAFLVTVGLLQKFEIKAGSSLSGIYDTNMGLTNNPKSFEVILKQRNDEK